MAAVAAIPVTPAAAATSQTITFAALAGKTYGAAPFAVSATASSGLPVSFSSLTTPVCTVSGVTVTIVAAGTCTVRAAQAGDATYSAAPNVDRSFTVAKAAQTITFGALAGKTYGAAPFTVSATASSGLAVAFVSTTTTICTVSGNTVTLVTGGTCTIRASQAGNGNYNAAANVNQSFAVAKASQTITFAALAGKTFGAAPFTVSATASSGLAVTFTSTTTTVCTVSTATVTLVAGGTCTIRAAQAGNTSYLAATSLNQSFTVAKANQTITFAALANQTYGIAPFSVSATASSGLAITFSSTTTAVCTVSGSTVTLKIAGTCTIQAAQAGNASYNAATSVSRSFTVAKASQTITFGALANQTFGVAPFAVSATASSGLAVPFSSLTTPVCTVSGSNVTIKAAGTCTIQAAQGGNASYNAATSVNQSFTVAKANQTIAFAALANKSMGSAPFAVSATATSGLGVTFSSLTASVCTMSGATVTLVAAGTCSIQAAQAGNANYNAAPTTSQSFAVTAGSQTISFASPGNQLAGASPIFLTATASSGLTVSFASLTPAVCTVSGASATLLQSGTCTVQASQAGNGSYSAAPTVNASFVVIAEPQFSSQSYSTGAYPTSIAVGDFNGDGQPDLAVGNAFSANVSILLGNGDGTLSPGTALVVGGEPSAVVAGDFNGDGKLDLAVADFANNVVIILRGNGDGTFTQTSAINAGPAPNSIALADFNQDGKWDLAVTNGTFGSTTGHTVSIVLGNGDGTFRAPSSYVVGPSPYGGAVGDFNGDGKPDLAFAIFDSNAVAVLLGNGDGTFAPAVTYAVGQFPDAVAVGDFNGDGKVDLAVANDSGNDVSILLGNGAGAFGPAASFTTGDGSGNIAVTDINGDGWLDLVITNRFDNTVVLLLGNGDGTFQPPLAYAIGQPEAVAVRDLNGDGRPDMVVASVTNNTATVFMQPASVPASIAIQSGSPQSTAATTAFATPLAVIVRDAASLPVAGISVTFTAPGSGPSGTFAGTGLVAHAATNASGVATAPTFTSNASTGSFSLIASIGALNASFALTNTSGVIQSPAFTSGPPPNGTFQVPYSFTCTASGVPAPVFSVVASALPSGLALNGTTCLINGTPNAGGTFAGQLKASNGVAPDASQSFAITIAPATQGINFGALSNQPMGAPPFTVSATASSGLPVTFSSQTPTTCSVNGTTVTMIMPGGCTVRASQAGDANYAAAHIDEFFTITAGQTSQTITFNPLPDQSLSTGSVDISGYAMASSGLPVAFSSQTPSVCTTSGSVVTLVANGTCSILATQSGSAIYAAATGIIRSFTISATAYPPTITLDSPADGTYFAAPALVSLVAPASAANGRYIARVEIYNGLTLLGTAIFRDFGYTFDWTNVPVGTYVLSAKAVDNLGVSATSNAITIHVTPYPPPTVTLIYPATYSSYTTPTNIDLGASAASQSIGGSIAKVEFYAGQTLVGTATGTPFTVTWNNAAPGAYAVTARAYDSLGPITVSAPIVVTVTAGSAAIKFVRTLDIRTSGEPNSVAVGDFNGDGRLDLVAPNSGGQGTFIALGDGSGNFAGQPVNTIQTYGNNVVIGDFNGDGKRDIALVAAGNSIATIPGHGDGTFGSALLSPVTGGAPTGLVAADFNGDGKLDLAAINTSLNTVSILLGNGDGTFQAATNLPTGPVPTGVAAGDFNRDGKVDLVITNGNDYSVSIFLGNGNGTFQAATRVVTGAFPNYPTRVAVGDFNGDGKLDIAVTNFLGPTVSILLGNGDGTFQGPVDYAAGTYPNDIVAADLNGDGKLDLVVTNSQEANNTVSVLLGNGNGTFQAPVAFGVPLNPWRIAVGDLNGDGQPDLVVDSEDPSTATISLLINTTHTTTQPPVMTSGPPPDGVALAPYSFAFTATGTPAPAFSLTNASFTNGTGMTLAGNGVLTASPYANAGTYSGTVVAHNGVYPDALQDFVLVIRAQVQTINFPAIGDQEFVPACIGCFPLTEVVSSTLNTPVALTALTPGTCSISTSPFGLQTLLSITLRAVGTCTIRAEIVNGPPAPKVDRSFSIRPKVPNVVLTTPSDGAGFVAPANVAFAASVTPTLGATVAQVQFLHDGALIASVTSAPYSTTWSNVPVGTYHVIARATESFPGPQYFTEDSAPKTVVVAASPDQPTVAITAPSSGVTYFAPATITLTASASNASGTIAKVDFYSGTFIIGSVISAPFTLAWSPQQPGTYTVTAKATSANGVVASSLPVTITLDPNIPSPIAVYGFDDNWATSDIAQDSVHGYVGDVRGSIAPVSAPASAPKPDTCQAASFSGGTIDVSGLPMSVQPGDKATVAFWMLWNGVDSAVPLSFATEGLALSGGSFGFTTQGGDVYGIASSALASGWHHVVAEFTNGNIAGNRLYVDGVPQVLSQRNGSPNNGNALLSGTLRIGGQAGTASNRFGGSLDEVHLYDGVISPSYIDYLRTSTTACAPVTVALLAPANNSVYNAPATIEFRVASTSRNGFVNQIDIYNGTTIVASTASGVVWNNAPAGVYTLTAKATDTTGAFAVSAPITVTVSEVTGSSVASVAAPADGGTFYTSGTVHLVPAVTAAPSYSIAEVEFWADGQEIGWSTTPPYDFTWRNPIAGTHTITVKVLDNAGYFTTSAPITITVLEGAPAVTYYYNDVAGTPIAATDQNGNLLWDETYEPYGERYSNEDTGTRNGLWYTGKPIEDATGLSYYGDRWYNSTIGRFYSTDPVLFRDDNSFTFNRYEYANNNPYRFVDLDGREPAEFRDPIGGVPRGPGGRFEAERAQRAWYDGVNKRASLTGREGSPAATAAKLAAAARRAAESVGSGKGSVYGTKVHSAFEEEIKALGDPKFVTEQSYLNGVPVPRGTPGSIRVDVLEGSVKAPRTIYDLKTGGATLTPARIQQIQSHVPGGSSVPVYEVRP